MQSAISRTVACSRSFARVPFPLRAWPAAAAGGAAAFQLPPQQKPRHQAAAGAAIATGQHGWYNADSLKKNIIHLVDDIFWNCRFKTELQGEQVIIIQFLRLIYHCYYSDNCNYFRFMLILDFQTKFGWTNVQLLPRRSMIWEICFVWHCKRDGLLTLQRPIRFKFSARGLHLGRML